MEKIVKYIIFVTVCRRRNEHQWWCLL